MFLRITLLCSLLCIGLTVGLTDNLWHSFKARHGKSYGKAEEVTRRKIFGQNAMKIASHNLEADMGQHSFRLGINKYADWTDDEFKRLLGYKASPHKAGNFTYSVKKMPKSKVNLKDAIDWREENLVVGVKDQGGCGSCWAFSAIGSLEGQHAKLRGDLLSLSEQELVDCGGETGNEGCNGGLMTKAFEYLTQAGAETEEDYPYEGEDDICRLEKKKVAQPVSGFVEIESGSEESLQSAVAEVGPISVAIDAGSMAFRFYETGVYDQDDCGTQQGELNHGVTAIGYGSEDGQDYWLIKNSWGEDWGDVGYIKMSRNKDNQCGIATDASYPLL